MNSLSKCQPKRSPPHHPKRCFNLNPRTMKMPSPTVTVMTQSCLPSCLPSSSANSCSHCGHQRQRGSVPVACTTCQQSFLCMKCQFNTNPLAEHQKDHPELEGRRKLSVVLKGQFWTFEPSTTCYPHHCRSKTSPFIKYFLFAEYSIIFSSSTIAK